MENSQEKKEFKLSEAIQNKMTLKVAGGNFGILQRNGFDLICPLVQPMQIRQMNQPIEQVSIQKTACNTGCALFEISKTSNRVSLHCGSSISYEIEEVLDATPKAESEVIEPAEEFTNEGESKIVSLNNNKG